jgi:multiple sugar transport system permease protein
MRDLRKTAFPYLLVSPALFLVLLVGVYPLVYLLVNSLFDFVLIRQDQKKFIFLGNYLALLRSGDFWWSLRITIEYVCASTTITFFLGLGIALVLSQSLRLTHFFRSVFILPLVATPVIVALTWRHIWDYHFGIMNYFLSWLGIKPVLWLAKPELAMIAIIITDVWQWTPFVILVLEAGIASVPEQLFEAAKIDGCSAGARFWHITLPFIRPVIGIALVIRVMDLFRNADLIYVITSGGPGNATEVLAYGVFKKAFVNFQIGQAAALAFLLVILTTTIVSSLLKRLDVKF